jgi:leader peptidase (prepilin peptidase)/N-methyltransferase
VVTELEPLADTPGAYVFAVVLGLLWGSFANVCIYRWAPSDEFPKGRSVVAPGSHCFACKAPIRWYDNVPLLSFLWLRGRCRSCKTQFSARYLIVEALTGALFGVAWWFTVGPAGMLETFELRLIRFAISAAFVFVMVVITFIDIDTKLILNKLTIPSIVLFYAASLLLPERRWYDGLVGIAIGYGVPWLIGELYMRIRKREGLGLGDAMLLALVGALLGWKGVLATLFGGSMLGSVLGAIQLLSAKKGEDGEPIMTTELAFGPYLAAAAVFYLFAEPWIELHFRFTGG